LDALLTHEWQALTLRLEIAQLRTHRLFCRSAQRIHRVYFSTTAIISFLHTMEIGGSDEIAAVDREGMTGVPILTGGGDTMPARGATTGVNTAFRLSESFQRISHP
jgi:hypothetical protein